MRSIRPMNGFVVKTVMHNKCKKNCGLDTS